MASFLNERLQSFGDKDAIVEKNTTYTYKALVRRVDDYKKILESGQVQANQVVAIVGDYSFEVISLMLALIDKNCIIVPVIAGSQESLDQRKIDAQCEVICSLNSEGTFKIEKTDQTASHRLYQALRDDEHSGMVLFSTGSTGKQKGVVHDLEIILKKYKETRSAYRTIAFYLFDHMAGIDTFFYTIFNGGCLICLDERTPYHVLNAINLYKAELLPVSPTFLNLILLSDECGSADTKSLEIISYGTESMPEVTLKKCQEQFPNVKFVQKYGLSELGVISTKTHDDEHQWIKITGENHKIRIIDGLLQIKSNTAMLGYLNEPSPFTDDGWFMTGDRVEEKGEYIKILGRDSEMINVGGQKVYPAEVENIIAEMENIADVVVYKEENPITGNIVCAKVKMIEDEEKASVAARVKNYCAEKLESYKVPVKIKISKDDHHGERFKKNRLNVGEK